MSATGRRFWPGVRPPDEVAPSSAWFAFQGDRLLVRLDGDVVVMPDWLELESIGANHSSRHYLGRLDQIDCYVVDIGDSAEITEGLGLEGLRALYGRVPDEQLSLAGRAVQVLDWDRNHRYCGRCGELTVSLPTERAKRCPSCGLLNFPRLSPAVIMRIDRGEQVLLGRGPHFPEAFYSVLAGFVEPGESLEETVVREVYEEVGLEITDLRYFGSQPWPFPNSLMLGFTARYAGGEIRINPEELVDAAWFSRDRLPQLPSKMSISRQLIDAWLERRER